MRALVRSHFHPLEDMIIPSAGTRQGSYASTMSIALLAQAAFLLLGGRTALPAQPVEFQNSLGMRFHAVAGTSVLFSIWETRVRDWNAYLSETRRPHTGSTRFELHQTDIHPVANVTATEATEFCGWLTQRERTAGCLTDSQRFRLPTNAEWDAAAGRPLQGDTSTSRSGIAASRFPWGDTWPPPPRAGNFNTDLIEGAGDDGFKFTAPVGRFEPTPNGLFDVSGNVWEWAVDVSGQESATACLRGGSWMYWRKECLESSFRLRVKQGTRAPSVGFRCVLEDDVVAKADQQRNEAEEKSRRLELTARPEVSDGEVHAALSELAARRREAASVAAARASSPDSSFPTQGAHGGGTFVNSIGIKMLPLPGSRLLLGEHEVRIADFDIYADENELPRRGRSSGSGGLDRPVTGVKWEEAVSFCLWLTQRERARDLLPPRAIYRLPTLAEWSAAAWNQPVGSAMPSAFPWGKSWPPPGDQANVAGPTALPGPAWPGGLLPVKSLRANALGFFDLVGNAAEWCRDVRLSATGERIHCGGSFLSSAPEDLRDGGACGIPANDRRPDLGFRLSLELTHADRVSYRTPSTAKHVQ